MVRDKGKDTLTRLFPHWQEGIDLKGLYLQENLSQEVQDRSRPYIYANFIASLDGRIAVPQKDGDLGVPASIANGRDWRLFQELAVQSDLVISSGRYLRDYADGNAQEILQVYDDPEFRDLRDWRIQRSLRTYPDLAIVSRSLEFELPAPLLEGDRHLVVITTEDSSAERKKWLASRSITVLEAGAQQVEGEKMASRLGERGYSLVYSAAGPRIAHMLLAGGVLDRLYLTFALRMLGSMDFASILEGLGFVPPRDMSLRSLIYDPHGPGPTGQLFAAFDCR